MIRFLSCVVVFVLTMAVYPPSAFTDVEPGVDAPSFRAQYLDGTDFDLDSHLGKDAILICFWQVFCTTCKYELPKLVEIYEKYKDKGLVVVGVDLDPFLKKKIPATIARMEQGNGITINYPIVLDRQLDSMKKYEVSTLPTTVIIDRKGKIIYYHRTYAPGDEAEFEAKVRQALGDGA